MSKTGDTKKKILEILAQRSVTLTDISNRLSLAPSTVSQHLQELTDSGMIKLVEDRPRKWKYYELNRNNSRYRIFNRPNYNRWIDPKRVAVPIAAIAIALIAAFFIFTSGTQVPSSNMVYLAPGASIPVGSTVFTISDAPTFYNISSLVVTANTASIHSETTGKWYNIPLQTNSFDLIQLKNISAILSGVTLANGIYDEISLDISSVNATVNGTKESVILPSGKLKMMAYINITNDTTNWINIDFDLEHSLHITGNGEIIMMPVINIRHVSDNQLQLNESSIVIANGPGTIRTEFEEGMNQNGTMVSNYSVPQDVNVTENSNGKVMLYGNGHIPVIIRGDKGIIMGGDASNLLNVTGGIELSGKQSTQSSKSLAGIAYNSCISEFPRNGTTLNISANDQATLIGMCCASYAKTFDNNSGAGLNSSVKGGTISMVSITGLSSSPAAINCCYPTYINTSSSDFSVNRCWPIGVRTNSTEGFLDNFTAQTTVNGVMQHSKENVSASELKGGFMDKSHLGGYSKLNISINMQNGSLNTQCDLQNGALSCNFAGSSNPSHIAMNLGDLKGNVLPYGSNVSVSTNDTTGAINSTGTDTGASVSANVNSTANMNDQQLNVTEAVNATTDVNRTLNLSNI